MKSFCSQNDFFSKINQSIYTWRKMQMENLTLKICTISILKFHKMGHIAPWPNSFFSATMKSVTRSKHNKLYWLVRILIRVSQFTQEKLKRYLFTKVHSKIWHRWHFLLVCLSSLSRKQARWEQPQRKHKQCSYLVSWSQSAAECNEN